MNIDQLEQGAIKVLAIIRRQLFDYMYKSDIASPGELTSLTVPQLIGKLVEWAEQCDAAAEDRDELQAQLRKAQEAIEDMKRPMSAQMEMQNRTITALNGRLERIREDVLNEAIRTLSDRWLGFGFPGGGISDLDHIDGDTRNQCIKALLRLKEKR